MLPPKGDFVKTIADSIETTNSPSILELHMSYSANFALDSMREFQKLEATVVGYTDFEMILFPADAETDQEKEMLFSSIRAAFMVKGVDHYVYLAETWFSKQEDLDKSGMKSPSEDPGRLEGVMILGVTRDLVKGKLYPTKRHASGLFLGFGEPHALENLGGAPTQLLLDSRIDLPDDTLQFAMRFLQEHGTVKAFNDNAA